MIFSESILPTDGAFYTLQHASITGGILSIEANGSATYSITKQVLTGITQYFRVSVLADETLDNYKPSLYMYLRAKLSDGTYYSYTVTPTCEANKVYTEEVKFKDGDYTDFTCTIYSERPVRLQLYELCPLAADATAEVEIDGVRQALDRLLYDYNTEPITVDKEETTIGLITFNLRGDTDLQGHLEVSYVASKDCVVTIRTYDVGVEELYTPVIYDVKAGRGNIALPHSYLSRKSGFHTTYVTAQVSDGKLTIGTRGLLYTIDGGYLADRLMDAGMSVLDISVEQPQGEIFPTNIWAIGIDANNCIVKARNYNADVSEAFATKYTLGNAIAAALEFNGDWVLNAKEGITKYTIETRDEPYAFWVDTTNRLYCQQGEDTSTKFLVDHPVTAVSACRGFSSSIYLEQDQGLVVLYVKNGIATYRNLCRTPAGTYTWQGPFTIDIPGEQVTNASVHRLNDYRLSFCITTTTNNYWYITERTYINQAVPVEVLYTDYSLAVPVITMSQRDTAYEALSVTTATLLSDKKSIEVTFNKPIRAMATITLSSFTSTGNYIDGVEITGDNVMTIHIADEVPLGITVTYTSVDTFLQYSPESNVWMPANNFTVVVPGVTSIETLRARYSTESVSITQDNIKKKYSSVQAETLRLSYAAPTASITEQSISTKKQSIAAETLTLEYDNSEATIVQQQVGTKPI